VHATTSILPGVQLTTTGSIHPAGDGHWELRRVADGIDGGGERRGGAFGSGPA